jgi:hypothetical protein
MLLVMGCLLNNPLYKRLRFFQAVTPEIKKGLDLRLNPLKYWSWRWESNPRPADYKSAALPTELHQRMRVLYTVFLFCLVFF